MKNPFRGSHTRKITTVSSYLGLSIQRSRHGLIRRQALEDIFVNPALIDRILLKLSPVGIYDAATQAWAGTDLKGLQDFFDAVRQYQRTVIAYLYDREAFKSRMWFASDKTVVDWDTLPQFSFQRSSIETNAKRAFPDLLLLLITNIVLLTIICLILFIRSEV